MNLAYIAIRCHFVQTIALLYAERHRRQPTYGLSWKKQYTNTIISNS